MAQFKVVLDDSLELDKRQHGRINAAIQKAVLAEMATVDTHGDRPTIFQPELRGLIAYPIDLELPGLESLREAHEQFGR
jgi:hypothetical protein